MYRTPSHKIIAKQEARAKSARHQLEKGGWEEFWADTYGYYFSRHGPTFADIRGHPIKRLLFSGLVQNLKNMPRSIKPLR